MSADTGTEVLTSVAQKLSDICDEVSGLKVGGNFDYSTQGLEALSRALVLGRANAERCAELHAQAVRLKSLAAMALKEIKDDYQDDYDSQVLRYAKLNADLSWEERGSLYRTKMVDKAIRLRAAEKGYATVEALFEAIVTLTRTVYRAIPDMDVIVRVMQRGDRFGEFSRA